MMIPKKIAAVRRWFRVHQEAWRNTLIVVLVVGILVQGGLLWSRVLTRDSIPWNGLRIRVTASAKDATETDNEAAAMPIRFAARSADGMYGIQYNTEGLRTAYEETADIWAQALEHAEESAAASAADYRAALQGELLLMEYDGSVPMDLIAGWLDCTLQDELTEIRIGTAALCKTETGCGIARPNRCIVRKHSWKRKRLTRRRNNLRRTTAYWQRMKKIPLCRLICCISVRVKRLMCCRSVHMTVTP